MEIYTEPQPLTPERINDVLVAMEEEFKTVGPYIVAKAGENEYVSKERDGSPVTPHDLKVEKDLRAALAKRLGIPVFGEETGYEIDKLPPVYILIDPIDGTKDFMANRPGFTVMGVLIQNGKAVAADIFNPSSNDNYAGQKGKGAYKNGARINLGDVPLPPNALSKTELIPQLDPILQPAGVHGVTAPLGGGFGFTMVLDGLAAARFNLRGGGYVHDYAPGGLLVAEAGGVNIPILSDTYDFKTRSFVAAHPGLVPFITPHIAKLRELELAKAA